VKMLQDLFVGLEHAGLVIVSDRLWVE
jgi:hypothetical protein